MHRILGQFDEYRRDGLEEASSSRQDLRLCAIDIDFQILGLRQAKLARQVVKREREYGMRIFGLERMAEDIPGRVEDLCARPAPCA